MIVIRDLDDIPSSRINRESGYIDTLGIGEDLHAGTLYEE